MNDFYVMYRMCEFLVFLFLLISFRLIHKKAKRPKTSKFYRRRDVTSISFP